MIRQPVKTTHPGNICPNANSTSGCFCSGKCKEDTGYVDKKRIDQERVNAILASASGGEGGGSMFARYERGDDVYTQ